MFISAQDVKALRERTGCGIMDCKKALIQSKGDVTAAVDILRKSGLAASTKKAGRLTKEGVAIAVLNEDHTIGVCIEVNSETDFVARNVQFLDFVKKCAKTVIEKNPKDLGELLSLKAFDDNLTVGELLKEKIFIIGENMKIRRFSCFCGAVSGYTHANGKIATMVKFDVSGSLAKKKDFKIFAKDIAMHVAAAHPIYLTRDDVPSAVLAHEKEILTVQIAKENKPEFVVGKIIEGRLNKFYKETCLNDQSFVKDPDISVNAYVDKISKNLSERIKIQSFVRYQRGEDA
ncbi:MAG: translation elongation factor Ts [Oscillospiraceae bacterium]|jgi:elongation factor Ts|nr:translation elongation factor Ts [Oscillospiraceae bacterium]